MFKIPATDEEIDDVVSPSLRCKFDDWLQRTQTIFLKLSALIEIDLCNLRYVSR